MFGVLPRRRVGTMDVLHKSVWSCRRNDNGSSGQYQNDGVSEVGCEETKSAEAAVPVDTRKAEESGVAENSDRALADGWLKRGTAQAGKRDVRRPKEVLNGEIA